MKTELIKSAAMQRQNVPLVHAATGKAITDMSWTHPICSPPIDTQPLGFHSLLPLIQNLVTETAEAVGSNPQEVAKRTSLGLELASEMTQNPEEETEQTRQLLKKAYYIGGVLESLDKLDSTSFTQATESQLSKKILIYLLPQMTARLTELCILRRSHANPNISQKLDAFVAKLLELIQEIYCNGTATEKEAIAYQAISILKSANWDKQYLTAEIAVKILTRKTESAHMLASELQKQSSTGQILLATIKMGKLFRIRQLFIEVTNSLSEKDLISLTHCLGQFPNEGTTQTEFFAIETVLARLTQISLGKTKEAAKARKIVDAHTHVESVSNQPINWSQVNLATALRLVPIVEKARKGKHLQAHKELRRLTYLALKCGISLSKSPLHLILEYEKKKKYPPLYDGLKRRLHAPLGDSQIAYALSAIPTSKHRPYLQTIKNITDNQTAMKIRIRNMLLYGKHTELLGLNIALRIVISYGGNTEAALSLLKDIATGRELLGANEYTMLTVFQRKETWLISELERM